MNKEEFEKKYDILAHYKCRKCKREWKQEPRFIGHSGYEDNKGRWIPEEGCYTCGHIWVDWLNWVEVLERIYK